MGGLLAREAPARLMMILGVLGTTLAAALVLLGIGGAELASVAPAGELQAAPGYGALPLAFEPNAGRGDRTRES